MKAFVVLGIVTFYAGADVSQVGPSVSPSVRSTRSADSAQAFRLSSFTSTYPLVGRAVGRVAVDADSISVQLDSGLVQNRMPALASGVTMLDSIEIRAGVGALDGDGWRVVVLGTPAVIAPRLAPGDAAALRPMRLTVARPVGDALLGQWLVLELRAVHRGINGRAPGPFTTYICSDRDLVGPASASAARAAALARAYNSAC